MSILTQTKLGKVAKGRKERGASAVEYALIIALIAVAVFIAGTTLDDQLIAFFNYVAGQLPTS